MLAVLSRLGSFLADIRFAARSLQKSPTFLAVVIVSLAIGIGANATIFSVVYSVLYRPLPYPHPDRLVCIYETPAGHPEITQAPPIAELRDWKTQNHVFEDIALTSGNEEAVFSAHGDPQPVQVQNVTPNFFALLGVQPALGRIFTASEMQDASQSVLLSSTFWKTNFDGDPRVLGATMRINGILSTVVGVMPRGFAPFSGQRVDLWLPINSESSRYSARADHWLTPIGRLKQGVTIAEAQTEMDVIAKRLELSRPDTNKGVGKRLVSLHEDLFGWARRPLYPLFGAVAFVLLIACANVANLLQSRTETRRAEFAVRVSLGAGRARLLQFLFAETVLLALLGGSLGLFFAYGGIALFRFLSGGDFPNIETLSIDFRMVFFTLAVSLLTSFVFGLLPAIQASKPDLNDTLRGSGRGSGASFGSRARYVFAVVEVALAMVLLVGTGLMVNTMLRLREVHPGFDTSNLLTLSIRLPEGSPYVQRVPGGDMERATPQAALFYQQLVDRTAVLPGVQSVGSITGLPTHFFEDYTFTILGRPAPPPDQRPEAGYDQVAPHFFETLKVPLKSGRYLDTHDNASSAWVIVVNEAFVRQYFPNENPIGQQIRLRYDPFPTEEDRPRQIVGVVGDIKHMGLARPSLPFIYASYFQQPTVYPGGSIVAHLWQDIVLRTAPGIASTQLTKSVNSIVTDLDPNLPILSVMTMDQIFTESLGDTRFYLNLLGIFAAIAVLLAAVGIYGVMSYFVSRHTHEIGIRIALGAQPADVFGWIGKLSCMLIAAGVVLGAGLALLLTRLIATFLYGVTPSDPLTYVAVTVALVMVALLACFIPARRATKVDSIIALRHD